MPHNAAAQNASMTVTGKPFLALRLSRVRNVALLMLTLAVLAQLAIFFSVNNLIVSALILCGGYAGLYYGLDRQLLDDFPLSTLAIVGYTICRFVIPPFGKLADGQSILHGLNHPILVWLYGLAGSFALLLAHYFYRVFSPCLQVRWALTKRFYRRLHYFEMPDQVQFWLMGAVGIGATLVGLRHSNGAANATGGSTLSAMAKVLVPLIYVPYFGALPTLLDPRYETRRHPIRLSLVLYSVLLIAVSAMLNSRGFMLTGFVSMVCVYGYRVITGTIAPPKLSLRALILVLIAGWIAIGPMANLAASMLVVRKVRGTISAQELARKTWDVYRSGTATRLYQMSVNNTSRLGFYDEAYYNNIFLNRFGNMRFTDLSIDAAHKVIALGRAPYFQKIEYEKAVSVLPAPVIKLLNLDVNKKEALSGSSEDFLYDLATGNGVGGFKTGELLVIMRVTFGLMWPVVLAFFSLAFFIVIDASCDIGSLWQGNHGRFDCVVFNSVIAGMMFTYVFYQGAASDAASFIAMCTRDWVSLGIFYGIVFAVSKWMSSALFGGVLRQQGTID